MDGLCAQHLQHLLLEAVDKRDVRWDVPALKTYAETLNETPEAVIAAGERFAIEGFSSATAASREMPPWPSN